MRDRWVDNASADDLRDALDAIEDFGPALPLIKDKFEEVTEYICASDERDEENRGFRKGLRWVLGMRKYIAEELDKRQRMVDS